MFNAGIVEVEKKPFYQQWWFLVIVALTGVILIIIVVSLLCLTGRRKAVKYKGMIFILIYHEHLTGLEYFRKYTFIKCLV